MKKLLLMTMAVLLSANTFAQIEGHVKWAYAAKKTGKNEAVVLIKATIDQGWHIYSLNLKNGGPVKTTITFIQTKDFTLEGKASEPTPITKFEKSFGMNVTYFENEPVFQQKIKLRANQTVVKGKIEYMTCNDLKCLPPDDVEFSVAIK